MRPRLVVRLVLFTAVVLAMACIEDASASPRAPRGWRAYPNPFVNRFRIAVPESTTPGAYPELDIRVLNMRGHMVREWTFVVTGHQIVIDWDGQTSSGAVAPSGWYIFDVRFKGVPGMEGVRFKMLRIRGTLSSTYEWQWF
jgi:hypothetical protein